MVVANITTLEQIITILERLRNIMIIQQRGTRYDEFTDNFVALTPAQIATLQTARTNTLNNLQSQVAALT